MREALAPDAAGTLVTFTVIRKPPAAFAAEGVYAVGVVDVDGGGRVVARIEPFDPPPRLGARVALTRGANATPVFAVAEAD